MPRAKKNAVPFNIKMDKDVADKLNAYCEALGASKTAVVEKAVNEYLEGKEKLLGQGKKT